MRKFLLTLIILLAGCTTSSKTETSSASDSTAEARETEPVNAGVADDQTESDTTEKIMLTDVNDPSIGDQGDVQEFAWNYRFYGFSATTPTLAAYEQYGTTTPDNGDKGDLEFYAVNVAKNDYAIKPYRLSGVTADNAAGGEYIRKYNADHGLMLNTNAINLKTQEQPEITVNGKKFILRLLQRAPAENMAMFELHLINPATKEAWLLQADESLPKSRGQVLSYGLADAYTSGNNVAVMLYYTRSQLDKDQNEYFLDKYLMVTGSIASKSNFRYEPSKTEVCVLNYIGVGDCAHIEFSCGDFGNADLLLPSEDKALWDDLSDDEGNLKAQYKGKNFEITYTTTYGEVCGDPSDPNPGTTNLLVTGFKAK
jgi:hypothetical protein